MKYTLVVKTGVRRNESVQEDENGVLVVTTRSKPTDGAANKAVIALLSDYFKTPKSNIKIISGHRSKMKIVEVFTK